MDEYLNAHDKAHDDAACETWTLLTHTLEQFSKTETDRKLLKDRPSALEVLTVASAVNYANATMYIEIKHSTNRIVKELQSLTLAVHALADAVRKES